MLVPELGVANPFCLCLNAAQCWLNGQWTDGCVFLNLSVKCVVPRVRLSVVCVSQLPVTVVDPGCGEGPFHGASRPQSHKAY